MGDSSKMNLSFEYVPEDLGHWVNVDSFYIDKYEITNSEFKQFVESGGYYKQDLWSEEGWFFVRSNNLNAPGFWDHPELGFSHPEKPVVGVTYYEAEAYAKWVGKRLPTEAEWERAARGSDGRKYPWGNQRPDCSLAIFFGCSSSTAKVGYCQKGDSPYGVSDMAGNVYEWVKDVFDLGYFQISPKNNPQGPSGHALSYMVTKGGSFYNTEEHLVTFKRTHFRKTYWDKFIGFRCAKSK